MNLLETQKKFLVEKFRNEGLDASKLKFVHFDTRGNSTELREIKIDGTDFFIKTVDRGLFSNQYHLEYCPDIKKRSNYKGSIPVSDNKGTKLYNLILKWVDIVIEEMQSQLFLKTMFAVEENTFLKQDKFSADLFSQHEKYFLTERLNTFEKLIETIDLPEEEIGKIITTLSDIKNTSDKLTKKDWKNHAIGAFLSIIINLSLNPSIARYLWKEFLKILNSIQLLN